MKTVSFILLLAGAVPVMAQTTITSGTTMHISPSTTVTSNKDFGLSAGGHLDISGTLILKENLVNQSAEADALAGTGTIEFSGSANQLISGVNTLNNMVVNNAAGVTIGGNTRVNGTLTLTNGVITLGANNLTLGPAATVSGTPAATKMIAAAGSGELRKEFSGNGSFTFPVGDATATAEYSPVSLNFTAGTFGVGNYAGVSLVNSKYADDSIKDSYLNRYWKVTQNAITGFTCEANFTYVDADITGNEADLFCVKVNPTPYTTYSAVNSGSNLLTASGLNSFSTFTGAKGVQEVSLLAFLEGPYDAGAGTMNTTLKDNDLVPLTQPYNTEPWNYAGTESVVSVPANVVDWVLLELRQADLPENADPSTIIKKRAVFLKNDGTIVETDGLTPVKFYNSNISQNLYPVIRHRNHLAIMAANAVTRTSGIYTYDFSTSIDQAYGGEDGYKQIGSSPDKFGMVAGDADADGSIFPSDFNVWITDFGNTGFYISSDMDMDANVFPSDFNKWIQNFGTTHPIEKTFQQKLYQSQVPK